MREKHPIYSAINASRVLIGELFTFEANTDTKFTVVYFGAIANFIAFHKHVLGGNLDDVEILAYEF